MSRQEAEGEKDPFDGLVLDDTFIKGGVHEPPARTRDAIARYRGQDTSWRHPIAPGARPTPPPSRRRNLSEVRLLGISWTFLVLVAACAGSATASWITSNRIAIFAFVMTGWLISLALHEFAHAATAYAGGDGSVAVKGYLSLDLRRYTHWALTFLLPALFVLMGGIGLPGGAVWIDRASLRSRRWRTLTSLAGPAANAVLGVVCLIPFKFLSLEQALNPSRLNFWSGLAFLGLLQIWGVMLNLLPIPGLDGWGAIEPYLPTRAVVAGRRIAPFGFLILFFVVLQVRPISAHLTSALTSIEHTAGVPSGLAAWGYHLVKFWSN